MNVRSVVENAWLTVVARVAIFVATFIALPVAGWLLVRAANTVDSVLALSQNMQLKLVDMDGTAKLFAEQIEALKVEEADHEARLRLLERRKAD